MRWWARVGVGAGAVVLVGASVATSVALGLLEPATERSRAASVPVSDSTTGGLSATTPAPSASSVPAGDVVWRVPNVVRTAAQLPSGSADLYLPLAGSGGRAGHRFPLVLLVADPSVDAGQYEQLAHDLGTYGLAVVVSGRPTAHAVEDVRSWVRAVDAEPDDYFHDQVTASIRYVVVLGAARSVARADERVLRGEVRLAPTDVLRLTDEGRSGPRSARPVDARRLANISSYARSAALWMLDRQEGNGAVAARTTFGDHLARDEKTVEP